MKKLIFTSNSYDISGNNLISINNKNCRIKNCAINESNITGSQSNFLPFKYEQPPCNKLYAYHPLKRIGGGLLSLYDVNYENVDRKFPVVIEFRV